MGKDQSEIIRRGFNRTTVALANKLARIVWAVLRYNNEYKGRNYKGCEYKNSHMIV